MVTSIPMEPRRLRMRTKWLKRAVRRQSYPTRQPPQFQPLPFRKAFRFRRQWRSLHRPRRCRHPRCRHRNRSSRFVNLLPNASSLNQHRSCSNNHSEHPRPRSWSLTYPTQVLSRPRSQRRRPRPCSRHHYQPRCRCRPSTRRLSAPPRRTRLPRHRRGPHRGCGLDHHHSNSKPLNQFRAVNGCRIPKGPNKRSRRGRTSLRLVCRFFLGLDSNQRRS